MLLLPLSVVQAAPTPPRAKPNVVSAIRIDDGTPVRVVIEAAQEPVFTVFRLGSPPRVVVDVAGGDVSNAKLPPEPAAGLVALITATQFKDALHPIGRVVVGLRQEVPFDVRAEGTSVVVSLQPTPTTESAAAVPAPVHAEAAEPEAGSTAETAPPFVEPPPARTATKLTGIRATRKRGSAVLTLSTNGPVSRYEVQEVANPSRLVVDLFGVSAAPRKVPNLKKGPLSRVRLGKHETHVRVVLDARDNTLPPFDVASTDDGITVVFNAAKHAGAKPAAEPAPSTDTANLESEDSLPSPAQAPAKGRAQVQEVQFDEKNGFFRLKIAMQGTAPHRLTVDNPRLKVLELAEADLPTALERSLDATAYGGPVQAVATFRDPDQPGVVKVAVDLTEPVEHRVWHKGTAVYWDFRAQDRPVPSSGLPEAEGDSAETRAAGFAVEAASLSREGTPAQGRRTYTGRRITIDLKDADILNVLRLIAEVSKLNIIASDEVRGAVTIKLRNVPWDQALDIILKVKGLGMEKNGNIIRVAPASVLRTEKEARDADALRDRAVEPTVVKLIPVNYANAAEMLAQVQTLLSARGKATVDKRTNVIIADDLRENIFQAERLVRTLDSQTPQILIEARIIEANASYTRGLGIQWGYSLNFSQGNGNPTGLVFPNNVLSAGGAEDSPITLSPGVVGPNNYAVNLPAAAADTDRSALGISLGSIGNVFNLNLRLTAAETDGQIKIVSSPKIATLDNKTAKITQGVQIPVARVSAAGTTTQLIPASLDLDVTPHVTADGSVLMKLRITNNAPDFSRTVGGVPSITTKETDTEVMVRDGETTVVGGIYTRNLNESYRRSPFLGSLPVIGWLFKAQNKSDDRKELLAFITPRIVNRDKASVTNMELGKPEKSGARP
jgi:type IV pilus assembly protein PilQ